MPVDARLSEIVVPFPEEGQRLDVFLSKKFMRSRSAVRSKLSGAVVSAEGRPLKWSHRLRGGELIRIRSREVPEPQVKVDYRLLYQDQHLLAVDKGAGAPVHPVRSWRSRTVLTRLRRELHDPEIKPAHRLDRETSGVLLFARTPRALTRLMEQFRIGRVSKRYLAVVRGIPGFDRIEVEAPLSRDPDFPVRCRMRVDPAGGRLAQTRFEVIERKTRNALVAAVPRTGRQHQIRVHLAHLGYPVVGDKLYQEDGRPYLAMIRDALDPATLQRLGHWRQALHAESLSLVHPIDGEALELRVELPGDLKKLLI